MADRPILFSGPMVRALLAGTKTQTRRGIVMPSRRGHSEFGRSDTTGYDWHFRDKGLRWHDVKHDRLLELLQHQIGDRLWVKETWRPIPIDLSPWDMEVIYHADGEHRIVKDGEFGDNDWTMPKAAARGNVTPLFMPRWASRLALTVTDVRVERLQAINEYDARAEGVEFEMTLPADVHRHFVAIGNGEVISGWDAKGCYSNLWEHINGSGSWAANPWIAAYTFTVQRGNIDHLGEVP